MSSYLDTANVKSHLKFMEKTLISLKSCTYDNTKIYDEHNYIMVFICDNNKLYIEGSDCLENMLNYYIRTSNNNSWFPWLKANKPKKLLYVIETHDLYSEDAYVMFFMYYFGIDKVRGCSFMDTNIDSYVRTKIFTFLSGCGNIFQLYDNIDEKSRIISSVSELYTHCLSNIDISNIRSKNNVGNKIIADYFAD